MNQEHKETQCTVQVTRIMKLGDRRRRINQYIRGERIGKGKHGEVFLCQDQQNDGRQVAMKVVRRTNPRDRMKMLRRSYQQYANHNEKVPLMSTTEHGIRKEIAMMKKCCHPNIVRLFEVIDDPRQDKIYLTTVMEYLSGGPVEWTNADHGPILLVDQTRRIIRDVIVGLDYLHQQGIIHRDIKPANLLWTEDRTSVKIIDFGVSHFILDHQKVSDDGNEYATLFSENDIHKRIGTPSFLAPEVVWFDMSESEESGINSRASFSPSQETVKGGSSRKPPITKAIDVWSLAVTFYCLLFGHTPFNADTSDNENIHHSEYTLYYQICTQNWSADETMGADSIKTGGRYPKDKGTEGFAVISLLNQMLQKDPRQRITLEELKRHPWFLRHITDPEMWLRVTSPCPSSARATPILCRWVSMVGRKLFGGLPGLRRVLSSST